MSKLNKQLFNALNGIGGSLRDINALIEAGANINTVYENGHTPLHIAAQDGRTDLAKFLVEKGADVDLIDEAGNTPLRSAIISGHTKCAKFLIEHTVSKNHQTGKPTKKPDFLSDESYRLGCNRGYLEKMSKYWEKEDFFGKNQGVFNHMSEHCGYVINKDESLDTLRSDAGKFLEQTLGKFYIKDLSSGNLRSDAGNFLKKTLGGFYIKDLSSGNLRSDAGNFLKKTLGGFYIKDLPKTKNYKGLVSKLLSEPNAERVTTEIAID